MAQNQRRKAENALLLALACGATAEAAGRQCGLSQRTIFRRLADPAFKRQLQALRADMVQRTSGALTAAATEAVRTLLDLQKGPQPPAVRLGAAKAVLELGLKIRESAEFEERLIALEEAMASQNDNGGRRRWGA
jgi:hypothetical protein